MMGGPHDDEGDLHRDAPFLFESARPDPAQPGFWHELLAGVVELEHQQFLLPVPPVQQAPPLVAH